MNFSDNNSNMINNGTENDFNMSENANLDVNKKNSEYYDKLMTESGTNKDSYYDKNNPFVKILLIVLLVIIVVGSAIVFLLAF